MRLWRLAVAVMLSLGAAPAPALLYQLDDGSPESTFGAGSTETLMILNRGFTAQDDDLTAVVIRKI